MSTPAEGFDLQTVDKLLTTTRAVRRRLDVDRPVPLPVVKECLALALQAPTGSNWQTWRWLVITDPGVRSSIADLYRTPPDSTGPGPRFSEVDEGDRQRVMQSAQYLTDRLQDVPVLVVPCVEAVGGAAGWPPSIYPAVWSFMLALRSRGLGSVLTTHHLYQRAQADAILGVPDGFVQACMVPVAYYKGTDFQPAKRRPLSEVAYLDHWGTPLA